MEYNYLIYVRKFSIVSGDNSLYVYGVKTDDIFHTLGEIYFRSETHIDRIDFVELTSENYQTKIDYWFGEGVTIYTWIDKYKMKKV